MTADQEYKRGVRAAFTILAVLCGLCVLASLSGCLTATKIGEWQRAVHLWGMSEGASQTCKDAADSAAQYIAKANTDLLGTGKLTDLSSDSHAKQLLNSAALACGKAVP